MTAPLATPLILRSAIADRIAATNVTGQAAVLDKIIEESDRLQSWCNRRFDERIETRYYTARGIGYGGDVYGPELWLDDDLRSVTTLINGDGTAITTDYTLLPRSSDKRGVASKDKVRLSTTSGLAWSAGSNDPVEAISLAGLWGYGGQWKQVATVTSGLAASIAATSFVSSAALEGGMMLRVGTEYIYVDSTGGTTTAVTRACNGSTAALHADATVIYRWEAEPLVQKHVARLVLISLMQDSNPLFGQMILGDFQAAVTSDGTPKDVLLDVDKAGLRRPVRVMAV
jgi:hypothetical protein